MKRTLTLSLTAAVTAGALLMPATAAFAGEKPKPSHMKTPEVVAAQQAVIDARNAWFEARDAARTICGVTDDDDLPKADDDSPEVKPAVTTNDDSKPVTGTEVKDDDVNDDVSKTDDDSDDSKEARTGTDDDSKVTLTPECQTAVDNAKAKKAEYKKALKAAKDARETAREKRKDAREDDRRGSGREDRIKFTTR